MARIPAWLLRHRATVEPYEGTTGAGPAYGTPTYVRCFFDDERRLVRDDQGQQVVSESILYTRLEHVDLLNAGARVTRDGRESTVISARRRDDADAGAWQHLAVSLT